MSSAMTRILITGLGNFTLPRTRHSIGQYIIDSLSDRLGFKLTLNERLDGLIADGETTINNKPAQLYLFKPRSLMNVNGLSIGKACRATVQDPRSVIVIHDTLKLEPGRLKVKLGGNTDGHRGIRSVTKFIRTTDYFRLQVGVGRSGVAREYVLGPLSAYEKNHFGVNGEGMDEVWQCIEDIARRMEKPGADPKAE